MGTFRQFITRLQIIVALCPAIVGQAQNDTVRALFLGNSYTAYNNLPSIAENLATAGGNTLITDRNTPGGYTLEQHAANSTSLNKIRQGNWDFVVLQEQSQVPTINYHRLNSMYPGAVSLNDSVKKYNPCAKTLMYMTWGRRYGGQQCDGQGIHCSPVFAGFSHMQDSLEVAYKRIADSVGAQIAPVGMAWKHVINDTAIVLHTSDDSHPNYNGSYLAACVFHRIFWDDTPTGLNFHGSLDSNRATYLRQVADSTVSDSISYWNLDPPVVNADFSYFPFPYYDTLLPLHNHSVSPDPVSYFWDFGDGQTSTEKNPTFVVQPTYETTITLIVMHCGITDTLSSRYMIITEPSWLSMLDPTGLSSVSVFPNPVQSILQVDVGKANSAFRLVLMDHTGRVVKSLGQINELAKIPMGSLPAGLYLLKLEALRSQGQYLFKVVKK